MPKIIPHKWTHKDEEYVLNNYGRMTAKAIGDALGVSKNAIIGKYNRMVGDKKPLLGLGARECRFTQDGKLYCAGEIVKHSYCQEHLDFCYQRSKPRPKKVEVKSKVVLY